MLTTKKLAQVFVIFSLGFAVITMETGCAPAGARALLKGERLIKEGKYSEAVEKFQEATKALPNNAKAWNHLGLGYQYAGDTTKAVQAYQQALSLDRNLATARYNLGTLYLEQRNFPAAIMELTTFTSLDSKSPEGWLKLGTAQMQQAALASVTEKNRLLDAAKKNLDAAQKLHPSAEALNALGMVQIQRGRARDAIPDFASALQLEPNYAPALLNSAVVYHQYLNERRLALANYQQYLSVAKNSPETAQVRFAVRQLESELNPPRAAITPAPAVVSNKPQAPANIPAPAKMETNVPKVVASPKASAALPTTKVQPLPKKETPVEVARLPDETPFRVAADVPSSNINTPAKTFSKTATPATRPVRETESPDKKPGVLAKLNPASWFKKKPKTASDLTTVKPTIEINTTSDESNAVGKTEIKTTQPSIPRYRYRSPRSLPAGNRSAAEPLFAQGLKAQRDHRLAEAVADYRRAIKLDPAYFEAYYNLALAARESGDLASTLSIYEQALAITPDSLDARYNFAFTLQETGYFLDAASELRKVLALNPNETRAHLLLGNLCAQRLDQTALAREHYLAVLQAEPQHPQATQIRYWLAAHP